MKLSLSLLGSTLASNPLAGCGQHDDMVCETQCPFTNVGRKWKAKQQFMFHGEDHIVTRLSPSYAGLENEKATDFRFLMRFDRKQCSKKVLDAIYDGTIGVEVMDKSLVYSVESMDLDYDVCKSWQHALYVQVRHTNTENTADWMQKDKDLFYMSFHGLRDLDPEIGTREDIQKCMEMTWIDRIDSVGNENSDYTKCMGYARCDEEPNWGSQLPDYNDLSKTLSCGDDNNCTLTLSDGQSFIGYLDPETDVVHFRGIYYAEAPTGQNRWKAPIPITFYDAPVDATTDSPGCVNQDSHSTDAESEDCLHVNLAVARSALENGDKLATQAYIHGGSLTTQSNNLRDFSKLAENGVLSVSINYRLGAYGFLPLAEIEEGQSYKANWGFQDQLAGLKWISMYAGAFGGDKDSVVLDGCSAGSFSGFYHLSNEASWPYFNRAILTGIGVKNSANYQGARTDKITETVLATAGVDTIDALREMSVDDLTDNVFNIAEQQYLGWVLTWSSGVGQPTDGSLPVPGTVKMLSPEDPYQPMVDGITMTDILIYKFRRGEIRPNTPIAWSISENDSWLFRAKSYAFIRDYLVPSISQTIRDAEASTGFEMPPPYIDMIYELLYPDQADQMKALFGCIDGQDADCREGFARLTQFVSWTCPTKWAFSGAIKDNPSQYGDIYPMHFEVPNCEWVDNVLTKTCHCAEQNWVQGSRPGTFGEEVGSIYLQFYKEGTMPSEKMKTWAEMNYNAFNIISNDDRVWTQEPINNWAECDLLDAIHATGDAYTEGHTLANPTGGWPY